MENVLSEKLKNLAFACPFPLYVVGGAVRDFIAGLKSDNADVDVCAPVSAEDFVSAARKSGAQVTAVYRNTGTVKFSLGGEEYEFACFRSDEYVRGVHKPVKTFFTEDINLDARRRDFKCNAVYYDIKKGEYCDPLGGIKDIGGRKLSTVADADKVFGEDGLRLMRFARQSAQTGFKPERDCLDGAKRNRALIADVSAERVYAELNSLLLADTRYGFEYAQYDGLKILDETGVLDIILPELVEGRGMKQREQFHDYDVLEHSLRAVKYADKSIRLAALLHDVGKPCCMRANGNYHGHERESARLAADICARLKVSKKTSAEVCRLAALHMYDVKCDARENKIRKLIVANYDIFPKLLLMKQADFSACKDNLAEAPCVTKWKGIYEKMQAEGAPFTLKQLNVRGDELLAAGIPPASIGEVLSRLLTECACDPKLNRKEVLIRIGTKLMRNS